MHINDIKQKFLSGLTMPGGINLQRVCLDTPWAFHEKEFAKWILFEACTLYEGWAEKFCKDVFAPQTYEKHAKALQFPTDKDKQGRTIGFSLAVDEVNVAKSAFMTSEFLPTLKASSLNRWASIEDHLTAYRYFKECRNAFIHSDGEVTQDILDWHAKLAAIQKGSPSPFQKPFTLPAQVLGEKIDLHLKDCILFATVVRKMICTFDAALCVSAASERLLEDRLRRLIATSPKWRTLPGDAAKREQRAHRMLAASRIPEPANFSNMMAWMQSKSIL